MTRAEHTIWVPRSATFASISCSIQILNLIKVDCFDAMQAGEVANRVLSVGSTKRAILLSQLLDPPENAAQLLEIESDRGFLTITGDVQCSALYIMLS